MTYIGFGVNYLRHHHFCWILPGQMLRQYNFWVIGLRLPGHGTAPSGLKYISWRDMAAAVRLGMAHLASKLGQKPIHIVGYSNGSPLALNYTLDALEDDALAVPASLVLISPSIGAAQRGLEKDESAPVWKFPPDFIQRLQKALVEINPQ